MMRQIVHVTPFNGRFLVLTFKDEKVPRVFDTLLIRDGALEKLNERAFFDTVFVDPEIHTVTWKGELDLDPDVLFAHSVPFSDVFISYFDVKYKEEAGNVVHDAYYDITGKVPSDVTVNRIIAELPERIVSLGEFWGWYDTEVREKIYRWIREKEQK